MGSKGLNLSNNYDIANSGLVIGFFFFFLNPMCQSYMGSKFFIGWSVNFSGRTVCVEGGVDLG